jgi:hypothetical protein
VKPPRFIILPLVLLNLSWNIFLYFLPSQQTVYNYLFNFTYSLLYFAGATVAQMCARNFKNNSPLHIAMHLYTLGLILYGTGQVIWGYLNITQTPIPYPGPSDFFFLTSQPFLLLGMLFILIATGVKLKLSHLLEVLSLSSILFAILYIFLTSSTPPQPISLPTQLLNIIYPLIDSFSSAIAIVAIRTQKAKMHPFLLLFTTSAILMTLADTLFSYRSSLDIYWNGDISDTFFMLSAIFIIVGLVNLLKKQPETTSLESI